MINVIGLGYIGLPTALMMASHGVEVVGTDYNKELVDTLNHGKTTFKEEGLDDLYYAAVKAGIKFTTEYKKTDMYIVSVPTPYDKFSKKVDACYVVEAVKEWGEPEYIDDEIFVDDEDDENADQLSLFGEGAEDPLYEKALDIVIQAGKASASYIQRRLSIGYNRAARLVEEMEERGIVGPANGSKPREIIHVP